ncbi:hypothetical protein HPP92_017998 [Vanilla planifolia]|uniref:Uncharacterized protein n=1 Tax=Vanilla planifolia TaxID=51239 RepID=A0A835UQ64_VANPL|nr:hypothetical protein HPP92_017998 [Vanilla planifolia]
MVGLPRVNARRLKVQWPLTAEVIAVPTRPRRLTGLTGSAIKFHTRSRPGSHHYLGHTSAATPPRGTVILILTGVTPVRRWLRRVCEGAEGSCY